MSIKSKRRSVALLGRSIPLDPDEFYQTRQGLYVWCGFRDRIAAMARSVAEAPAMEIASFDLIKDANDATIRKSLHKDHVFDDPGIFCAYLAGMVERQPGGQEGDLLTNGYANIFYVVGAGGEVFAVRVLWNSVRREWRLHAYPLSDGRWLAGVRVFSRN